MMTPSLSAVRGLRAAPRALILNRDPMAMGGVVKQPPPWVECWAIMPRFSFINPTKRFADRSLIRWALAIPGPCSEMGRHAIIGMK
jgi:hypothetical protein